MRPSGLVLILLAACGGGGGALDGPAGHDGAPGPDGTRGDARPPDAPWADAGTCAMGGYATSFTLDEDPISEGGIWAQGGGTTGLDWTNVATSGGLAHGTQTGSGGYDDSIALMAGCGNDHRVTAVIHLSGVPGTNTHEVELILRGSYQAHDQHLYECNIGYAGGGFYSQIMKLDGPIGTFVEIGGGAVPEVHDGDVFSAQIVGSAIDTYLNDVHVAHADDSDLAAGQPGIGFFWRGTESLTDFAFASVSIASIP